MGKVIGIDLGTTNSCVSVVEGGRVVIIPNRGGYKTTPSLVAVAENGKRLVGHVAKRQAITNAENTVYAAKRLIGRKWDSPTVRATMNHVAYTIISGPHDDARIMLRDQVFSIPEISAYVLREMKLAAEEFLDEEVSKAVVTVPAHFNDAQRQATKDAGRIAGLDVIRIINEPTAAALAYGYGRDMSGTIAVYDLGGGTFDVSILSIEGDTFEVIATAGDTFLGGGDFDRRVVDWLVQDFFEEHGIDLRRDTMAMQRVKDAAEKARHELSSQSDTEISLPFLFSTGKNEAIHLQRTLTRAELERLTVDLIERTIDICKKTVVEAGFKLDEVLLVGGMTRMPKVQELVAGFFGLDPSKGVQPDEVVAAGAAIQGAALLDEKSEVLLLDVTPHTLSIMIKGGYAHALISKNTTVPYSHSHVFTTVRDWQTSVRVLVLQGEADRAEENELLGEITLEHLRRARRGEVEIEVTFYMSADGILSVTAKDLETDHSRSIEVAATGKLVESEFESMISNMIDVELRPSGLDLRH